MSALVQANPSLASYLKQNPKGLSTIDFFDPNAVRTLNAALLGHFYGIKEWTFPNNYLCPPVPGRADHVHHCADLLASDHNGIVPTGSNVRCLDIGTGAACIYPLIGASHYGWSFVGSDIDQVSLDSSERIVAQNDQFGGLIELRFQKSPSLLLEGIVQEKESFDLVMCNPPFHASAADASAANRRKVSNLRGGKPAVKEDRNFGGTSNELWYPGGEKHFVNLLIEESEKFERRCYWFTSLISKYANIKPLTFALNKRGVSEVRVIPTGQGNKSSHILAWTFLDKAQRADWRKARW
jgi:23S rRNA (adenine1618-N6)-methyltransferase